MIDSPMAYRTDQPDGLRAQRRLGRFLISMKLLEGDPAELAMLFSRVLVLEAQYRWDAYAIEYVGLSWQFQPVPEGYVMPTYTWVFDGTWKAEL